LNRGDAYGLLSNRLEQYRSRGYDALHSLVDEPAASETVQLNGEDVVVDVAVVWKDKKRGTLCVWATAYGPSTWRMERLDERIVVRPGQPAAG
jgi:hypothetical protein